MTTTERLKRIGSMELKKRVGPNLIRGLIVSVFIHSAVVSIGVFDWGKESAGSRRGGRMVQVPRPKPPSDPERHAPRIRFEKPVLPDVNILIPKDEEPEIDEKPVERIEVDDGLLGGKFGIPSDSSIEDQGGWGSSDDPLADIVPNTAGIDKPWEKFVLREIEPVPLSINPNPKYPSIAAKSGIAGKVYVWVLVGVDGKVAEWNIVHVSAPGLGFEEAVEEIIGKWQFTPAIQGNSPVAVWVNIPFSFKMKN